MSKLKLGVIFGGISTEHKVSIISGTSVIENLEKEKYEIYPIYISKEGDWYKYTKPINEIKTLEIDEEITQIEEITDVIGYLKQMNVIFPVLHGIGGEDGTIQGIFELIKVPFVGCGLLASSVGMDKVYAKIVFEKAKLNQAKYEYIRKDKEEYIYIDKEFNERKCNIDEICNIAERNLGYPMFIKPSNSGSTVGINKAITKEELRNAIKYAEKFDRKILIEEGINGRELECAVLGNEDVVASILGEVLSAEEFYTYDAKYKNAESKTEIPAKLDKNIEDEIRKQAIKAFKAIDGKGLSRVDFFLENGTNKIYINEINTLPGFTKISMYPKLFDHEGLKYKDLLNKLIELAQNEK